MCTNKFACFNIDLYKTIPNTNPKKLHSRRYAKGMW